MQSRRNQNHAFETREQFAGVPMSTAVTEQRAVLVVMPVPPGAVIGSHATHAAADEQAGGPGSWILILAHLPEPRAVRAWREDDQTCFAATRSI